MKLLNGPGIQVITGAANYVPQTGTVRWNGSFQCFEVSTNDTNSYGVQWVQINNESSIISLDPCVFQAVMWANAKQAEEARVISLESKHPELKEIKDIYTKTVEAFQKKDDDLQKAAYDIRREKESNNELKAELEKVKQDFKEFQEKHKTWEIMSKT